MKLSYWISASEELQVADIVYNAPLGKSNHSVIGFRYNCYLDFTKSQKTV